MQRECWDRSEATEGLKMLDTMEGSRTIFLVPGGVVDMLKKISYNESLIASEILPNMLLKIDT